MAGKSRTSPLFRPLPPEGNWQLVVPNEQWRFFSLKAECANLSFYPGSKTLNVQGMKEREMRERIASFTTVEDDEFVSSADDDNSQDGGEAEEEGENEAMSQVEQDNTETVQNTQSTLAWPINANHCCCSKNTAAIIELSNKFAVLEAKKDSFLLRTMSFQLK